MEDSDYCAIDPTENEYDQNDCVDDVHSTALLELD